MSLTPVKLKMSSSPVEIVATPINRNLPVARVVLEIEEERESKKSENAKYQKAKCKTTKEYKELTDKYNASRLKYKSNPSLNTEEYNVIKAQIEVKLQILYENLRQKVVQLEKENVINSKSLTIPEGDYKICKDKLTLIDKIKTQFYINKLF